MIAIDPTSQFNDTLTRLKFDALQKLAQALAEATDPADICRITKVLLTAKLIAPPKPEGRSQTAHHERGDQVDQTPGAPRTDVDARRSLRRADPPRRSTLDEQIDGNLLQRQDASGLEDPTRNTHAPRPAETDEGRDALAHPAQQQHRLNALE